MRQQWVQPCEEETGQSDLVLLPYSAVQSQSHTKVFEIEPLRKSCASLSWS